MLVVFEATSDLKVNVRKGSLFPIKEVANNQALTHILRCRVDILHTLYLGMPLGRNKAMEIWDGILEKTEKN